MSDTKRYLINDVVLKAFAFNLLLDIVVVVVVVALFFHLA